MHFAGEIASSSGSGSGGDLSNSSGQEFATTDTKISSVKAGEIVHADANNASTFTSAASEAALGVGGDTLLDLPAAAGRSKRVSPPTPRAASEAADVNVLALLASACTISPALTLEIFVSVVANSCPELLERSPPEPEPLEEAISPAKCTLFPPLVLLSSLKLSQENIHYRRGCRQRSSEIGCGGSCCHGHDH